MRPISRNTLEVSEELQQLTNLSLNSESEIEQAVRQLLNADLRMVVVSMGKQGAMLVEQTTTIIATPPPLTIRKTFGAGDTMVAGLIAAQIQELGLADSGRLATAFSLTAITRLDYHLMPAKYEAIHHYKIYHGSTDDA